MPEYLAPGVYIEETGAAVKAIRGASTSTAGMVGLAEAGPVGTPTFITSWANYRRVFGGHLDPASFPGAQDSLSHAVQGFFTNGGSRIFVVRVTGDGASLASATFADGGGTDTLRVFARSVGSWGDAIRATVTHVARISTDVVALAVDGTATRVQLGATQGISAGDTLQIAGTAHQVTAVLSGGRVDLATAPADADVTTREEARAAQQPAVDAAQADFNGDPTPANATALAQANAALEAARGDAARVQSFDLLVERMRNNVAFETEAFTDLSLVEASPRFAPRILGGAAADGSDMTDGASTMVRVHALTAARPAEGARTLGGGTDGARDGAGLIPDAAFIGAVSEDPDARTGIQALANESGISLVAVPGIASVPVQNALVSHCEAMKYRFAVLDAPRGAKILEARDHRNNFDTTRAALYYPWIQVADPAGGRGARKAVPPSGHVIGIYARTDNNPGSGVWKAPANEGLRGLLGLDAAINKAEQDLLNPLNVNCLRDFRSDQRGLRVWGARTLSSQSEWLYVPVRRTFLYVGQSLDAGLQWATFEPNAKPLWDGVRQSVTNFLDTLWRNGGLAGATQEEAFFVNVGFGITMEQDDLDNGRLIVEVGIAPVFPAEFVILRLAQKTLAPAA